jgi:hypothetical protein
MGLGVEESEARFCGAYGELGKHEQIITLVTRNSN